LALFHRLARLFRPGLHGRAPALALQGGGALGAFTWGVLDRLLETPGFEIAGLSGASAGAVNAVVTAAAWTEGGAPAARAALERVWRRVSETAQFTPFGSQPFLPRLGRTAGFLALDVATRLLSPYQLNPLALHPLREILAQTVDFAALAASTCPPVLISATRIADGTARIFGKGEITLDAVIASTALPLLHHAVEIEGEAYWDGGYVANPPLRALAAATKASDIVIVQLIPSSTAFVPRRAPDIAARLNQIVFNRPLLDEIAQLAATQPALRLHRLVLEPGPDTLPRASALSLDWNLLTALRDHGRAEAEQWLAAQARVAKR
jgi:NTE family protein